MRRVDELNQKLVERECSSNVAEEPADRHKDEGHQGREETVQVNT